MEGRELAGKKKKKKLEYYVLILDRVGNFIFILF